MECVDIGVIARNDTSVSKSPFGFQLNPLVQVSVFVSLLRPLTWPRYEVIFAADYRMGKEAPVLEHPVLTAYWLREPISFL